MKKILLYITLFAGVFAAVSCDKNLPPVFDDANAFVAFDIASTNIDEAIIKDDGSIVAQTEILRLPVTLGSAKGLEETVKFTVTDGTAKAGVNFNLKTASGTLTFDAEHRTQYIEFEILYYPQYTGDVKFTVSLAENDDIALGYLSSCTITINDVDHPLSDLLGKYKATGESYWYGVKSWDIALYKDEKDDHMVWFYNLYDYAGLASNEGAMVYGVVNDDLTAIAFPVGQTTEWKHSSGNPILMLALDANLDAYDSGTLIIKINKDANGKITGLDFGDDYGFWSLIEDAGNLSVYLPGIKAVKL